MLTSPHQYISMQRRFKALLRKSLRRHRYCERPTTLADYPLILSRVPRRTLCTSNREPGPHLFRNAATDVLSKFHPQAMDLHGTSKIPTYRRLECYSASRWASGRAVAWARVVTATGFGVNNCLYSDGSLSTRMASASWSSFFNSAMILSESGWKR